MVPWWIAEDLEPATARRVLKAMTAIIGATAARVGLVHGELAPLMHQLFEIMDTGDDREDLEVALEAVVLALGSIQ
jgi:hypothetical protein